LYFWRGDRLTAATIDAEGIRISGPESLFDSIAPLTPSDYDVSPDGRTLALVRPVDPMRGREIVVAYDLIA
jgi:hypothetical protein